MGNAFQWLAKKVGEKLLGEALDAKAVTSAIAAVWTLVSGALIAFLRGTFVIRGWWLAIIVGSFAVSTLMAVWFGYRMIRLRPRRFRPIMVLDREREVEWELRDDPRNWLHLDIRAQTPEVLKQVLAGPYHLADECHEELYFLVEPHKFEGPRCRPVCPQCDYGDDSPEPIAGPEEIHRIRVAALRELQRLKRGGVDLTRTVTLEKPFYWGWVLKRWASENASGVAFPTSGSP